VHPPTPPGAYKVGTLFLEAIDASHVDPFTPTSQKRRLLLSFFYPTSDNRHSFAAAAYLPPAMAANFDQGYHLLDGTVTRCQLHAYKDVILRDVTPLPVILFSPGFGEPRELYMIVLENLASDG